MRNRTPDLDKATVLKLRTIGVEYLSTHWSSFFQEWVHHVMVSTPSSRHMVIKTDEGIAALLREAKQ
jgi:hypothetical protein